MRPLYFHSCPVFHSSFPIPAPFFHSRPYFHSAPSFHSHPPFPFPRKRESPDSCANGANCNEEVQAGRCPSCPRQWEIPAFAGMGSALILRPLSIFISVPPHSSFPIPAPFFHSRPSFHSAPSFHSHPFPIPTPLSHSRESGNLPTPAPTAQITIRRGAVRALPAPPQTMGDSRLRGNGECFNFASSLYFHSCPAPFLISHSRSLLPFLPLFPFPPPPSIPTLFPFPPPFPIPAKAGISRLPRQRRKLQ